jgi:predicted unusual protein kinase regulating ubiquinone biosynthesis (AarF/ABC1/UbiB family)
MDIVVAKDRLNEMKKVLNKAIDSKKMDVQITFSLLQKQAVVLEDLMKMIEEATERLDLMEESIKK